MNNEKDVKNTLRLTKLEINGFKSFARKTELAFDKGITAVIGPNGSGKSNIADAVRWVLGEQSAKALRGAKMEDVIFNGTEERKPQAFCEVALTFDNDDGRLPVDFAEVTVLRRVYRSGESEYMINRNNCRLKDINELFRDTGIGKEGYSIIGQGKVEEILSNKSSDRRAAFEEAAGVMRYRVRKEEAERKLENTGKNLVRLEDILGELTTQLAPLEQQSKAAQRYLGLRDELKDLELNVFLAQYDKYQERIAAAAEAIAEINGEEVLLLDTERELTIANAKEEERAHGLEQAMAALQNKLLTMMSGAEAHVGELKVMRERMENLGREEARLNAAASEGTARKAEFEAALSSMHENEGAGRALLVGLDSRIEESQAALTKMETAIAEAEALLEGQKNSIMESMNRLSDARSGLSRLDAMAAAFEQRLRAIDENEAEHVKTGESLALEREAALVEQAAITARLGALRAQKEQRTRSQAEAVRQGNEAQMALRRLEQQADTARSRKNVLEEMAKAHEGYYASVRNVMEDCKRNADLKRAVLGVVAELIEVPKAYETALEMALGSSLQNIVTPTPEDGKRVIDHLRARQYGRATLLPVSAMRPRLLTAEERRCLSLPGCIGVASELVKYDDTFRSVMENLLGRTVLTETLDAGIALNKRAGAAFRIATLQGDIINPGGSMTGGSVQKREFSLLGREREIKELTNRLDQTAREILAARQAEDRLKAEAEAEAKALAAVMEELHQAEIAATRQGEKLEMIERDRNKNQESLARTKLEREQIADNLGDIAEDRTRTLRLQSGIEEGSAATKEDVEKTQEDLNRLREAHERRNAALTEDRVERMAIQKEEDAAKNEAARLRQEIMRAERSILTNTQAAAENGRERQALYERQAEMERGISLEQKDVQALKEEQHALDEERNTLSQALSETRARKDEILGRIRELGDRRHRQELNQGRAEVEQKAMQDRIWEEYQLTYENILPIKRPVALTAAYVRIDELKAGIRELGSINVNAIEDYRAVFTRQQELETQCEDLTKAQADLMALIRDLTTTMERQFLEQFERIQENFGAVFEQLFGGGHAELRLSDKNDVLNCDIDIIAQPPGKKLQLLSLLSGGERALTAIALLFAMLKLKPTAFCVLDEIESSLDEVNVTRFANYLKDYAKDTQFIIITHRKGSMEVCNALYGVAMEERGVSKVVSARFYDTAS